MVEVELLNWSGPESVKVVAEACKITADSLKGEDDKKIIRMLVENDYTSAIEHIWFTFKIRCSIICQRELLEHRIASHTTRSTRYCYEIAENLSLPREFLETVDPGDLEKVKDLMQKVQDIYIYLTKKYGREYARYILPLGLTTEFVWTINARSLINFIGLRLCRRASPEIRELAQKVHKIVKELVPEIFEHVGCRGQTLGVCPENEARPDSCPFRSEILTKKGARALAKWPLAKILEIR